MRLLPPLAAALGVVLAASACGSSRGATGGGAGGGPPPPGASMRDQAATGIEDAGLAALLRDHWDWAMERSPIRATNAGDHRFDDRLADNSAEGIAAERAGRRQLLARAKGIPLDSLGRFDRVTLQLLIGELESSVATEVCESHLWNVSAAAENPVGDLNELPRRHMVVTPADGRNLIARYRQMPRFIDNSIAHLRAGAARGLFGNAESGRRVLALVDGQLGEPLEKWPLYEPATAPHPGWSAEDQAQFAAAAREVIEGEVRPAFARYRAFLADEILPRARGPEQVGIGHLPLGPACYRARIAHFTGLPLEAAELHRLGLSEIRRINGEMVELGARLFGPSVRQLDAVVQRLRTDPALYFRTAEEIQSAASAALAAAKARIPDFFGRLPHADCVVMPIPAYEAPFTTIAYYEAPNFDGSKPGQYFVNIYKPEVRPRFEMQVLTYHESIPGHHLQIALGHEQPNLPAFRRILGSTAFVEGWALYTERLAGEMNLYTGDLDRMGMLSYDAWRASRLVVDTGIHSMGWTREQAEAFMREHTALTEENIRNEVDRYIGWPAQALAYKVGQLEILRLRHEAEESLGAAFDLRRFHDAVLANGAVTLPVLASEIERWLKQEKPVPPPSNPSP